MKSGTNCYIIYCLSSIIFISFRNRNEYDTLTL